MKRKAGQTLLARPLAGRLAAEEPVQAQRVADAPQKMPVARDEESGTGRLLAVRKPDAMIAIRHDGVQTIGCRPEATRARIGITAVLHSRGSAITRHPHVHMIVPGGGIAPDGSRWVSSRPAFLLPVRVLGKLFRRLFLTRLIALHDTGRLSFFGSIAHLTDRRSFLRHLAPGRTKRWGRDYRCGQAAALALDDYRADSRPPRCVEVDRDRYKIMVAHCFRADGSDVAAWMVRKGHALDWPRYSKGRYGGEQRAARATRSGVWSGPLSSHGNGARGQGNRKCRSRGAPTLTRRSIIYSAKP